MNTYKVTLVLNKVATILTVTADNSGQAKAKVTQAFDTIYAELTLRANKGSHI